MVALDALRGVSSRPAQPAAQAALTGTPNSATLERMAYVGGKDGPGVWQRIVNELPAHDVFISPFLGDCAVLRHKWPASRSYAVDADAAAVASFSGRVPPELSASLQLFVGDGVDWLWHAFDLGRYWPRPDLVAPSDLAAVPSGYLVERFGVQASRCLVYCDPPYLISSRRGGGRLYRCEMSDADHVRLLQVVKLLPCACAVSHYPCPLYDEGLKAWRCVEYAVMTRGGMAREKLWMNFPPAVELHDARWLGADKREREKFRRRRENLRRKLLELSPVERQSILAGLD